MFWEIAHCILHFKVVGCVTTLKTQQNKKTQKIKVLKLGNYYTKNCGLNAKFENFIFKDNPNVQCTLYINVFWIAIFPHSLNLNTKKSDKKGRCFEMQLRRGPDSAVSVSFLSRGPQPRFLHFKPFQFLISHWQPGSRLRPRAHLRHSIFLGIFPP